MGTKLTKLKSWKVLKKHLKGQKKVHLRTLFNEDKKRGKRMVLDNLGIYFDYSKQRVTKKTLKLLLKLADETNLEAKRKAMFSGKKINVTEDRAVLHIALRSPKGGEILVDGKNVVPDVHEVLDKMASFSNKIRSGEWKGHTGKRIKNIVNIGIGGSDLGPVMAYEALKYYSDRKLTLRFVSNVDGSDFSEAVVDLKAEETLFIIASKTFTTMETMANAETARKWSLSQLKGFRSCGQAFCCLIDK